MSLELPPAAALSSLPREQQAAVLGLLFEPCDTLVEFVLPVVGGAASWPDVIERVRAHLQTLSVSDARTNQIIAAHPRLGAKKVDSAQSRAEQATLGGESEAAILADMNAAYEAAFPGLRYVVFVARRPRSEIVEDMKLRIAAHDRAAEVARAFNAMCDIAMDRQGKMLHVDVKTKI